MEHSENILYYENILCVRIMWLVENGIISYHQYKYLAKKKQINVVRKGCRNTPALVAYDSLPSKYKEAVKATLGCEPAQAAKVSQIEQRIEHNAEMSAYFENYELEDGRHLPKSTRNEYYTNAIILDAIGRMIAEKRAFRNARNGKATRKWDEIAEGVQELDCTKYPHTLPANPRRLEARFKRFKKEGLESLIHKNFMNKHAASVDDEVKESYLIELLSSPKNLDNAQVARLYNMIAERMNWKDITSTTVARYREKHFLTIYAGRRGSVAFSNKLAMQIKRSAPTAPLLYWTLDGWDAELLYQKTEKGKTTYHHRPTIVIVLDACLKYPIGYAIGTHETPKLIQAALRNAAQHTAELFGKMYRTHQIQSDRYAIKKMTPYYDVMAKHVTPARAKNAKAKVIEPYFNSINKKWCQLLPNWSGFGITTNRDKQPNTEYMNKVKASFPDFEGVVQQLQMIIERERNEKIERYMELWNSLDDDKKIELTKENYLLQFGETTGRTILMQHSGLHPVIFGQRRDYDCFDITFRDHIATKWRILYDPDDLEKVLAVNEDESLRYVLEQKHVLTMALADRKEGDSEQLQRVREFDKELVEEITERRAKSGNIVREHLNNINAIEDETLKRLLLTDSQGQHKNVKSRARTHINLNEITDAELVGDSEEDLFDRY